jgi:hypothetical protein
MGYVSIYKVEEAITFFNNSFKYLDQTHPSWTDQHLPLAHKEPNLSNTLYIQFAQEFHS